MDHPVISQLLLLVELAADFSAYYFDLAWYSYHDISRAVCLCLHIIHLNLLPYDTIRLLARSSEEEKFYHAWCVCHMSLIFHKGQAAFSSRFVLPEIALSGW